MCCSEDGGEGMVLFYGCRHEREELLYKDEWKLYQSSGVLTHIVNAFSHDKPHYPPKLVFVNQNMEENSEILSKYMEGHIQFTDDEDWKAIPKTYPDKFRYDVALTREQTKKDGGKMYIQEKAEEYADETFDKLEKVAKSKDLDHKEFNSNLNMCSSEDGSNAFQISKRPRGGMQIHHARHAGSRLAPTR